MHSVCCVFVCCQVAQTDLVLDTVELLFPTANRRVLGETGGLAADTYLGNNRAGGRCALKCDLYMTFGALQ